VHFAGRVSLLEDEEEKRQALTLMIRQMEPDPEPLIQRLLVRGRLTKTIVGRVQVSEMTGKRNALELLAKDN
jgi:nitroimidazol reductase NimA-like FMN-containing flavoprotein (pyridoxamine 5'-phosphate oxidase superfamily)